MAIIIININHILKIFLILLLILLLIQLILLIFLILLVQLILLIILLLLLLYVNSTLALTLASGAVILCSCSLRVRARSRFPIAGGNAVNTAGGPKFPSPKSVYCAFLLFTTRWRRSSSSGMGFPPKQKPSHPRRTKQPPPLAWP